MLVFYQLFCSKTVFALCILHSLSRYQTMKNIMKKKYCYTYLCVIQLIHSWNIARFVSHPPLNQFYPCQQKNGVTPPHPLIIKSQLSSCPRPPLTPAHQPHPVSFQVNKKHFGNLILKGIKSCRKTKRLLPFEEKLVLQLPPQKL